jgi:hypothetical protein
MVSGRRAREGGRSARAMRCTSGLAILSACAVAVFFASTATWLGEDNMMLLQWAPSSLHPTQLLGPGLVDEGGSQDKFVWGPPVIRPMRAQKALQSVTGKRDTPRRAQQEYPSVHRFPSIRVEVNQNHDQDDKIAPVNINIQLPDAGAAPVITEGEAAQHSAKSTREDVPAEPLQAKDAAQPVTAMRAADEGGPASNSPQLPSPGVTKRMTTAPEQGQPASDLNSKAAVDKIDADGDSGYGAISPLPDALGATKVVESKDTSKDSDDLEAQEAAEAFSPKDSGAAAVISDMETGDANGSAERRDAAAVFSPQDIGDPATAVSQIPKPPALWLVGSPGHPHPAHDIDTDSEEGAALAKRGGKHSNHKHSVRKARTHSASVREKQLRMSNREQQHRMTELAQASDAELSHQDIAVTHSGAIVVPLPDLETMSGGQLVALKKVLQYEEREARDSAMSMAGMDRAKALTAQIKKVRARVAEMPMVIEKELAQNEADIAKKQRAVQVLKGEVDEKQKTLAAVLRKEAPEKLRHEEHEIQAKVELMRAATEALADVLGKQKPTFSKLEPSSGGDMADKSDQAAAQESEATEMALDLARAKAALASLQRHRQTLLRDMEAVHSSLGEDAASEVFSAEVGDREWLKQQHSWMKLAARGRETMLAEEANHHMASHVESLKGFSPQKPKDEESIGEKVSHAWDKYMDENDPSHYDQARANHNLRVGIANTTAAVVRAVFHGPRAPKFQTVDPKKDGWKPLRRHRDRVVETLPKVKELAKQGVGVGREGPKVQFCQWGSELVPCAPGYGGAWIEDHPNDQGIWGEFEGLKWPKPKVREHVKAGRRSKPYLNDMFTYGTAGIFGARHTGGSGGVYKGPMLNGGKLNVKSAHKANRQPRKITQMSDLIKQDWDWRLAHRNPVSPEFVDTILEGAKRVHVAKRSELDDGQTTPAKGWSSIAAKQAGIAHGIVSPDAIDAMLDPNGIARAGIPTEMQGKQTVVKGSGWVNEGAKNSARVFGIMNPQEVDNVLSKDAIAKTGIPTEMEGKAREAKGWVNAGAKNSAAVFGIVNPQEVDNLLSKDDAAKTKIKAQTAGKVKTPDNGEGIDASENVKKTGEGFGLVDPSDIERLLKGGQLAMRKGRDASAKESGVTSALDTTLQRSKQAEMARLKRLASVSFR